MQSFLVLQKKHDVTLQLSFWFVVISSIQQEPYRHFTNSELIYFCQNCFNIYSFYDGCNEQIWCTRFTCG